MQWTTLPFTLLCEYSSILLKLSDIKLAAFCMALLIHLNLIETKLILYICVQCCVSMLKRN